MTEPSKTKAVPTPRTNAIHDLIERGKFIEAIRQVTELETALSDSSIAAYDEKGPDGKIVRKFASDLARERDQYRTYAGDVARELDRVLRQNECDMVLTGDEIRRARAVLARNVPEIGQTQCPVCETATVYPVVSYRCRACGVELVSPEQARRNDASKSENEKSNICPECHGKGEKGHCFADGVRMLPCVACNATGRVNPYSRSSSGNGNAVGNAFIRDQASNLLTMLSGRFRGLLIDGCDVDRACEALAHLAETEDPLERDDCQRCEQGAKPCVCTIPSQSNIQRAIEHLEAACEYTPDSGTCDIRAALQWLKGNAESNVSGGNP